MTEHLLSPESIDAIDEYWATSFGCPREALRPSRTLVLPHGPGERFNGLYAMTFGGSPIVSVPQAAFVTLRSSLSSWTTDTMRDAAGATDSVGAFAGTPIGPAWVGYADEATLRSPPLEARARLLSHEDAAAVDTLRESCTPLEWEHGGSALGHDITTGSFANGTLAALAGYETWGGRIAHIAVIAHPAHRAQGHARTAVALVARLALGRGLVLQYRTLEANTPSRRIADSLGFVHYATSLAIRFL
jgi:RimJ/RimL family protein N-acetyltransferase